MKNINELWEQVINKELSIEEIDQLSIEEVREYDNLFICYFAQMGDFVDLRHPFGINYIRINKKIKKLNL